MLEVWKVVKKLNITKLEEQLTAAIDEFANEVKFNRETGSEPVTHHDLEELGRQTFYTLERFKTAIIECLKQG